MTQLTIFDELKKVEEMTESELDDELIERIGFEKWMDLYTERQRAKTSLLDESTKPINSLFHKRIVAKR